MTDQSYSPYYYYLRAAVEKMCQSPQILRTQNGQTMVDKLHEGLGMVQPLFHPDVVGKCIESYIASELDFWASDKAGLGPSTRTVPRLAWQYRRQVRELRSGDLEYLKSLMRTVILSGYMTGMGVVEERITEGCFTNSELLYHAWLVAAYGELASFARLLDRDYRGIASGFTHVPRQELESFMGEYGMKPGNLFGLGLIRDRIVFGYANAGIVLRMIEVNKDILRDVEATVASVSETSRQRGAID